jgi:hypothetical protein
VQLEDGLRKTIAYFDSEFVGNAAAADAGVPVAR